MQGGANMQYSIDEVLKIVDISKRTLYNNKDIMTDSECVQRKGNRNYFTQKAIDILKQRYNLNRAFRGVYLILKILCGAFL